MNVGEIVFARELVHVGEIGSLLSRGGGRPEEMGQEPVNGLVVTFHHERASVELVPLGAHTLKRCARDRGIRDKLGVGRESFRNEIDPVTRTHGYLVRPPRSAARVADPSDRVYTFPACHLAILPRRLVWRRRRPIRIGP